MDPTAMIHARSDEGQFLPGLIDDLDRQRITGEPVGTTRISIQPETPP